MNYKAYYSNSGVNTNKLIADTNVYNDPSTFSDGYSIIIYRPKSWTQQSPFNERQGVHPVFISSSLPVRKSIKNHIETTYENIVVVEVDHPEGLALTGITYSTVYGGKSFVIAKFSNGDVLPFYDGALITDWTSGIVTAAMVDNDGIAKHLQSVFSYKNSENEQYSCSAIGNKVRVTGPLARPFDGSLFKNSDPAVKGVIISEAKAETPSVQAQGSFVLTGGAPSVAASATFALRQHLYPSLPPVVGMWVASSDGTSKELFGFQAPLPGAITLSPCNTVTGSGQITGFSSLDGVVVGMTVTGPGIPEEAKIVSIQTTPPSIDIGPAHVATLTQTGVSINVIPPQVATIEGFGAWSMAGGIGGDPGQRYAAAFAYYVNENSSVTGYSASYWHGGGGWNRWDPGRWTLMAPANDYDLANGRETWVEFSAQPFYPGTTGGNPGDNFFDYSQIRPSPYYRLGEDKNIPTGRWIMRAMGYDNGVLAGGVFNGVTSVKVDGVEILGQRVAWRESHSATALDMVTQINQFASSTEYVASVKDSARIVITGATGSGESANGKSISVSKSGNADVTSFLPLSGGQNAIAATSQVMDFTIDGDFKVGDKYAITIIDSGNPDQPYQFGATRVSGKIPSFSITYKGKEYAAVGSTLYFSALNNATKWGIYDVGSGFIDMSNNFGGREDLTGAGVYQNSLAVFTERNCQLWFLDPDPTQNAQQQVLDNTGCIAPNSVVSVGAVDLFYLSYNGIRSLQSRESTDAAYANDIGSPIDDIVIDMLSSLTPEQRASAKAIIEPTDGRYWISIGSKLFVLSYFKGSGVLAWSEYVTGFPIEEMNVQKGRVYVRSGNKIYLYGGQSGKQYDNSQIVVELPYLDANRPAGYKQVNGIDATCEGEWTVQLGFDYTNPTQRDTIALISQPTFALGRVMAAGIGTHIGPRLTSSFNGYCRLANLIVHYSDMHSKHEG
jgi:hypothetical protein